MDSQIYKLAKALASGVSRRETLAGLLAGAAVALPWTSEAKKGRRKKNRRKRKKQTNEQPPTQQSPTASPFAKLQGLCDEWCQGKFLAGTPATLNCIEAAKSGIGPCYSATEEGPGFFCLSESGCTQEQTCCPDIDVALGLPVTDGICCSPGTQCFPGLNATGPICL